MLMLTVPVLLRRVETRQCLSLLETATGPARQTKWCRCMVRLLHKPERAAAPSLHGLVGVNLSPLAAQRRVTFELTRGSARPSTGV